MKKYKSLGVNASLNAIKSGLSIIFPLITYPYALRVLHAEGIGKVNYSTSIVSYFTLIAALGISTYAVRTGARYREDKDKFSVFCNQIFSFNVISTVVAYCALFIFLILFKQFESYQGLILLLSLSIAFTTIGVEWVNTIYEDFLYITVRSIITHLVSLVLLFVLVKDANDYYYYAFLTVLTNGIICVSNWIHCRKYVHLKFTIHINFKQHFRSVMTFFANAVATTIYVNSDTTMLGYMVGDYNVGLYALAVKIYNVVKSMLAAMYSATIPRISYYAGQGDTKSVKKIYTSVLSNLTLLLLPAATGMAFVSREIVLLMGGTEYLEAVPTLQILSVSLVGAIFGGAATYCLNIPLGREKTNMMATMISACINVGLNIFLIPIFKQNGAALTTAISEFFVFVFCLLKAKDFKSYIDGMTWIKNFIEAVVGCVMIGVIVILARRFTSNYIVCLIISIALSVLLYGVELIMFRNPLAMNILKKLHLIK